MTNQDSVELLKVALDAARQAAQIHQRHVGRVETAAWSNKGSADFVSFVDHEAEACIVECIHAAFPDHEVLAEEAFSAHPGNQLADAAHREWLWLVDPLDGTTNFLHGYPMYCASVAVAHRGSLLAAAVVCGPTGEEWCAEKGKGAERNGKRIRVSRIDQLKSALIGTGFPFKNLPLLPGYLDQFDRVLRNSSGVRRAGSAALDLCHVASGYFDGFWELDLYPWDIAAGALMIQEAGGTITSFDATDRGTDQDKEEYVPHRRGGVIAGNPSIHPALRSLLMEANERAR
jgi:myo-inositol-1(or 4)-monophosphatase